MARHQSASPTSGRLVQVGLVVGGLIILLIAFTTPAIYSNLPLDLAFCAAGTGLVMLGAYRFGRDQHGPTTHDNHTQELVLGLVGACMAASVYLVPGVGSNAFLSYPIYFGGTALLAVASYRWSRPGDTANR